MYLSVMYGYLHEFLAQDLCVQLSCVNIYVSTLYIHTTTSLNTMYCGGEPELTVY